MGELSLFKLTSETDLGDFYCGLPIMDEFIHSRLQKYYRSIKTIPATIFVTKRR